jgi:methionyl-tRNA formyltransferase
MKPTSKTLIFFGNERLSTGFQPEGAPTLQALIDNGYDVQAVVSHFTPGTSRRARRLEIEEVATAHNIPVLLPNRLIDIKEELLAYKADAGVLAAYGKIIPQEIIDIFNHGIINIHPSLLPLYRGSTPIEQAILESPTETGVSLMKLVRAMDAGPIFAQEKITLTGTESKQQLTQQLLALGSAMLIKHLPAILAESLTAMPQEEPNATYTRLLTKEDGVLDVTKTATQLEREVRAFQEWPKSRVTVFNTPIIVTKARVVPENTSGKLVIACGHASYLEITELTAPSGKSMSGEAFMRGYRSR